MDLSYVFSNNHAWIASIQNAGHDLASLKNSVKDIINFIEHLPNDEIEDFIYRLKIFHEKSKGNPIESDPDAKTVSRISLQTENKTYFFKILNSETVFKKGESKFYCELCGVNSALKAKNIRVHIKAFHT